LILTGPDTRISVLGGSSPFTAAFIDALVPVAHGLPPCRLVLQGRSTENLELVSEYGRRRLERYGWRVEGTTDRKRAVEGSRIIIHQNRYGGMAGRERDEAIAIRFGAPPDETLGPGALHSILRILPDLRDTGHEIAESCPDAWILNLTNPLSIVTAILMDLGVKHCVGLCELPLVTARQACEVLELPFDEIEWSYTGLNHRGFVTELRHDGKNRIQDLPDRLESREIGGIAGAQIAALEALPTKYFRIISGRERPSGGRAAYLDSLRDEIAGDLRRDPATQPGGLRKRYLEWYPQSVVPMIAALLSEDAKPQIVNVRESGALVEERRAWVSSRSFELEPEVPVNGPVRRWLEIYRSHEETMLRCVREPSLQAIREVLIADPVKGSRNVDEMAEALWEGYGRHASAEVCHA
jgi:6-phospho-beta-glucosidase